MKLERNIYLEAVRMKDRQSVYIYMHELFDLPSHTEKKLKYLEKDLQYVDEDVNIILTHQTVREMCRNGYSYKVMLAIARAAEKNHHLHIHFDTLN